MAFLFQVYFLNMLMCCVLSLVWGGYSLGIKGWINLCKQYWFVTAYVILYILTPILNTFIDRANKKQIKSFLCVFFCVQTIIGFVCHSDFADGYSALSFIGLYILARYMHLYPIEYTQLNKYVYLAIYFVATIVTTAIALLLVVSGGNAWRVFSYCSPFVILASVCLLLFFSKISIRSKIVNWIVVSCFAAYVVHCSPIFFSTYLETIKRWFDNEGTLVFLLYTTLWIVSVFAVSILFDKIRILVWNLIATLFAKLKENKYFLQ